MTKPVLQKCNAVIMAALMGQGLHVVTRPAFRHKDIRYVALQTHHMSAAAAQEDFKFCHGTNGDNSEYASYHEYGPAEVLTATL